MNIWYVHPTAGGPGLGRHWRPYWLADAWSRMGHRALVVCSSFHHLMQGPAHPSGLTHFAGVDYWFIQAPAYRGNSLSRLRNNAAFARRLAADADKIARSFGRPDLIVASTPHLFHIGAMRRIARRNGAKFWVEVRDLWPESIVAFGLAARWHPLMMLMAMQERSAYRSAGRLISLLAGAEPHMRTRGLAQGRFLWIPNGVSEAELRQAATPPAIEHPLLDRLQVLRSAGKRVVVYTGAMGPPNAIDVVLGTAQALAQTNPQIHFALVGGGVGRDRYRKEAHDLSNVEFADEVERPVAHAVLRASDCAVIAFRRNALYRNGISPNKLFDSSLFAPRLVVACEKQALAGLEELVSIRCEPEDTRALSAAIVSALEATPRSLEERSAALKKFSYSLLAARYLAVLEGAKVI